MALLHAQRILNNLVLIIYGVARLSIFTKLFVSILLVCLVMLGSMTWLINTSFQEGLQGYINDREVEKAVLIADKVGSYYSTKFGWQRLISSPYLWAGILNQYGEPGPPNDRPKMRPQGGGDSPGPIEPKPIAIDSDSSLVPFGVRTNLLDADGRSILGMPENLHFDHLVFKQVKVAITVENNVVGYISILQSKTISGNLAESFFKQQSKNTFTVTAITILLSFVIAFLLVRHFLKPLKALHEGALAVEGGQLDFQIGAKGRDELAELSRAFNRLVQALKKQKNDREQWISDISHELRTPIAVMRSEIEAMQDGIRKPEPQYIASLHQQVMTLGKLVNDLYELTLSDSGVNFELVHMDDIGLLLAEVVQQNELRAQQRGLSLTYQRRSTKNIPFYGDRKALQQLFLNLLENSLRYTDSPGMISISIIEDGDQLKLQFEDSYPSVPDESLGKLFDRLYRVDKSRSRASGGAGIGLSICKNIVELHGGQVIAKHSTFGGLCIEMTFPIKRGER